MQCGLRHYTLRHGHQLRHAVAINVAVVDTFVDGDDSDDDDDDSGVRLNL